MLFVVSSVEQLPARLAETADAATVHFPWGSLLRGLTSADDAVLTPIARLVRAGGALELVLQTADVALAGFERHGLALVDRHLATDAEVAATRSRWAKRLGIGPARPAVVFRFRRGG